MSQPDIAEVIAKALHDADPIEYDRIAACDKLNIALAVAIIRKHVGPLVENLKFILAHECQETPCMVCATKAAVALKKESANDNHP